MYPVPLADFAVRTAGDPKQLTQQLQRVVWTLDKNQPVTNVATLTEVMSDRAAQRRFQTLLLIVFAFVAVSLTTIGVFGVLSYSVTQRTSELGIRVALGAQPSQIVGLILRQASEIDRGRNCTRHSGSIRPHSLRPKSVVRGRFA